MIQESTIYPDFPKIKCPFVRKNYEVNRKDWKNHKNKFQLRDPSVYLTTTEVDPELGWVFDEDAYAVEKLHGSNHLVEIKDGSLVHIQNRKNVLQFNHMFNKHCALNPAGRVLEAILNSANLSLLTNNSLQYGELLGPQVNLNIHMIDRHLWYPFEKAKKNLRYKSFDIYPKEFYGWSEWFRTGLKSLLYCRLNKIPLSDMWSNPNVPFTEGIVIYQDYDENSLPRMGKLRRDMFDWYYGSEIEILGLEEWRVDLANKHGYHLKGYN